MPFLESPLKDKRDLTVEISHSPHSGNFFIDFSQDGKYIVSVKISEAVAISISNDLKIKITI